VNNLAREEKISHKQMRILRLRFDELNREFEGKLSLKSDYIKYHERLHQLVNRALRNSGFDKTPIYIDRRARKKVPVAEVKSKGNVLRRSVVGE
jgi:hypothetical protein